MQSKEWKIEKHRLPKVFPKFHYVITPHHEELLYSFDENPNQILTYIKKPDSSLWNLDDIRSKAISSLLLKRTKCKIHNMVFFYDNKGDLCVLFNIVEIINNIAYFLILFARSNNYGKIWDDPINITPEWESWEISSKPIILHSLKQVGNILIPIENWHSKRALTVISEDNGKTWNFSLCVEPPDLDEDIDDLDEDGLVSTSSPSVYESENGNIVCIFNYGNDNNVGYSISSDKGITWHPAKDIEINFDSSQKMVFSKTYQEQHKIPLNVYSLGMISQNSQYQLQLIENNDEFDRNISKWISSTTFDRVPLWYSLYMDLFQKIHLLYIVDTESKELIHASIHSHDLEA